MMKKIKSLLTILCACLFMGGFSACKDGEEESLSQSLTSENSVNSEAENSFASEENSSTEEIHTHQWDNETVTTPPTCETAGVKTFACACGESYTEEIPVLGHSYKNKICTMCGAKAPSQGLQYKKNDDEPTYSVSGIGACTDTEIVIPSTYNNVPVTRIRSGAFEGCSALTSVEIPNSVMSIGDDAFYNTAYYNDENNWENDVLYIGEYLIEAKDAISGEYIIKDGTSCIADYAFYNCDSLTSVEIPDSVTSIGKYAFFRCDALTSVEIPNSVISIGVCAFAYCDALTSVVLSDSVTSIGAAAFGNCPALTSITVLEGNTVYQSIDGNLYTKDGKTLMQYANGKKDTSFTIPDSVTSIGVGAFIYNTSLTSVKIPDSLASIGEAAFVYCFSLTSVEIGDSVTSIGDLAFVDCDSLTSVYYKGTAEEWSVITIGEDNAELIDVTVYYYSEEEPTEAGNWWRYVDGEPTAW